jgi:AraC-like DNA-binding protein
MLSTHEHHHEMSLPCPVGNVSAPTECPPSSDRVGVHARLLIESQKLSAILSLAGEDGKGLRVVLTRHGAKQEHGCATTARRSLMRAMTIGTRRHARQFLSIAAGASADRDNVALDARQDTTTGSLLEMLFVIEDVGGAGQAAERSIANHVLDTLLKRVRQLTRSVAGAAAQPLQGWRLKRVLNYIDENIESSLRLSDLAQAAGLSAMYFAAQFRAATGQPPHSFVLGRRIEAAQHLMRQGCALAEVALNIGFKNQAHFSTVFKRFVGDTPKRWQIQQREAPPPVRHQ